MTLPFDGVVRAPATIRAVIATTFRPRSAARNALALVMGTSIAQAIPIAVAPVVTRIYTPEDYGAFALYTSVATVVASMATGQYASAIVLPSGDEEADDVASLALFVTAGVTLLSWIFVLVFRNWIAEAMNSPGLGDWLLFVPCAVAAAGLSETLSAWHARRRAYDRIASTRVGQQAVASGSSIGFGLLGAGPAGMVGGALAGNLTGGMLLARSVRVMRGRLGHTSLHSLRAVSQRYRAFPLYVVPQSFLDTISTTGIAVVLGKFLGLGALGLYSFAWRLVQLPVGLVNGAVSQVFHQEAAARHARGEPVWPVARKVVIRSALLFGPVVLLLGMVAPMLISVAFGTRWTGAAEVVRALGLWIVVNSLTSPISTIPQIHGRQRGFLVIGLGYNLLQPASLALGASVTRSLAGGLWVLSVCASAYLIGVLVWFRFISNRGHGAVR